MISCIKVLSDTSEKPLAKSFSPTIRVLVVMVVFCPLLSTPALSQGQVTLASFDAGGWSGNDAIYDWLPFSPTATGILTTATTQLFACANGTCSGPAYYVVCSINAGTYNACPVASTVAISDGAGGYSACNGSCNFLPQTFAFSGVNQVTLSKGQTYYARPYICSYGSDYCGQGQALGGGAQIFSGVLSSLLSINPSPLAFPDTDLGTASLAQYVTLTNKGAGPVAMGTPSASQYFSISANTCGTSIAMGSSCRIYVRFRPIAAGFITGAITINEVSPATSQAVSVSGTGIALVNIAPSSVNFPDTTIPGTSPAQTITLTNNENQTLTIQAGTKGSGFALGASTCGTSMAPLSICTISLVFRPINAALSTGTFNLTESVPSGLQTIPLTGAGLGGGIALNTGSLTFPVTVPPAISATKMIALTNYTGIPVTLTLASASANFLVSSDTCQGAVAPRGQCTISVEFQPAGTGPLSGTLTLQEISVPPGSNYSQTVPLFGNAGGSSTSFQTDVLFTGINVTPVTYLDTTTRNYVDSINSTHVYHLFAISSSVDKSLFSVSLAAESTGSAITVNASSGGNPGDSGSGGALQFLLPFGLTVTSVTGNNANFGQPTPGNPVAAAFSCELAAEGEAALSMVLNEFSAGALGQYQRFQQCGFFAPIATAGDACDVVEPIINPGSTECLGSMGSTALFGDNALNTHQVRNVRWKPDSQDVSFSQITFHITESPSQVLSLIQQKGITVYVNTSGGDYFLDNFR